MANLHTMDKLFFSYCAIVQQRCTSCATRPIPAGRACRLECNTTTEYAHAYAAVIALDILCFTLVHAWPHIDGQCVGSPTRLKQKELHGGSASRRGPMHRPSTFLALIILIIVFILISTSHALTLPLHHGVIPALRHIERLLKGLDDGLRVLDQS